MESSLSVTERCSPTSGTGISTRVQIDPDGLLKATRLSLLKMPSSLDPSSKCATHRQPL